MSDLDPRSLVDILQHLRECRATVLGDAEAFQKAALNLEHIAQLAGAPVGIGLARSRKYLWTLLRSDDDEAKAATGLFEVVREARNMAVHEGAWVRQRSAQLLDLVLILEDAILSQLKTAGDLMVRSVMVAEPWFSLSRARRIMLSHSFSFLPLMRQDGWFLLSDEAVVAVTRTTSNRERTSRLAGSVDHAVATYGLALIPADTVQPDDYLSDLIEGTRKWPLLVTDQPGTGRLLGILTPLICCSKSDPTGARRKASGSDRPLHFSWQHAEIPLNRTSSRRCPQKTSHPWSLVGTVTLRKQRFVERNADVYRVRSITPRQTEFGQSIDGKIVRHLARALSGQTVIVEDAEKELRRSGLSLPYQYGHKLHFFAQDVLIVLVASRQAAHRAVGQRFEYDIA